MRTRSLIRINDRTPGSLPLLIEKGQQPSFAPLLSEYDIQKCPSSMHLLLHNGRARPVCDIYRGCRFTKSKVPKEKRGMLLGLV
ncbi:hypothetical protein ACKLNR_004220 [Fusarium oxysporum f. sp. zingiberi]